MGKGRAGLMANIKPLVAIVGRPNVGKSTFFNRMIGERVAVVEDLPGTTRDRIYGDSDWNGREFILIDTGGLELGTDIPVGQVGLTGQPGDIMKHVQAQAEVAIEEADVIVFMVDARAGINHEDDYVGLFDCHLGLGLRSEEHTSELQSQSNIVCRLLLEKKKRAGRQTALTRRLTTSSTLRLNSGVTLALAS